MSFYFYFSGKKRAVAATNSNDEDAYIPRYVCILVSINH